MIRRFASAKLWFPLLAVVVVTATSARPQPSEDLGALNRQVEQFSRAGKYAEATEIASRAVALAERRFGPDHLEVSLTQDVLARLYRIKRRYADGEQLLKNSLRIREKAFGPDQLGVCDILGQFAVLYESQSRYADAEPYRARCLDIREKALGPDHPDVGQSLHELARLYRKQGRHAEAERAYIRAVGVLGPNHPEAILAAINATEYEKAARALNLGNLTTRDREALAAGVRHTFLGQVTDLRWAGYRSIIGPAAGTIMIEGEATHGNDLWQAFAVQMVREGAEWKLRSISLLGLAWQ